MTKRKNSPSFKGHLFPSENIEYADYWTDNIGDNLDGQLLANMKDFSAQM
jgi:hypothetical protein